MASMITTMMNRLLRRLLFLACFVEFAFAFLGAELLVQWHGRIAHCAMSMIRELLWHNAIDKRMPPFNSD